MGKTFNKFYNAFSNPGLLAVAQKRLIDYQWVIEAGCHDGTDTLKFLEMPNVFKVYAFEPDEIAANKAEAKFKSHGERVKLQRLALMDRPGFIDVSSPTGEFGDGNSIVGNFRSGESELVSRIKYLRCSNLDSELKDLTGNGILWLDVEGAAAKVLTGAASVLKSISLIQVEVELHNSKYRKADFSHVNRILSKSKFSLIYAPLHPGFFGDAIYIKTDQLRRMEKMRSIVLNSFYSLLHLFVYPLIRKPKLSTERIAVI
jgi:FkbM family methyltransferase